MLLGNNFNLFIDHNQKVFKDYNKKGSNEILVEFNNWSITHITASYLSNVLSKKYNAKIIGYEGYTLISSKLYLSLNAKLKYFISKHFFGKFYRIYKSFNVEKFIRPKINQNILTKSKNKYSDIISKINSKEDLLNLKIEGILVGDLIYDTFLKIKKLPTISIESNELKIYIYESIQLFYYWINYFQKHKVKAVIIVHSTYLYGMIMRIACQRNIPVYRPGYNGIYCIKSKNYTMGEEFIHYPKYFKKLKKDNKIEKVNKSKKLLEEILKKKIKSSKINKYLLKKNNKKKTSVLIAMHNFYDSPHVFGKMLFPDFYEWLNFLVKLSQKTNYIWYLKLHPENNIKDFKFIKKIIGKKSKIKILPSNIKDEQVLKKEIQFVLTCYGTIGYEYAYLGLTIINACKMNPHHAYKFNLNPKNIYEYSKILQNLEKYYIKPSRAEILEFFYIRRFFLVDNWLDLNEKKLLSGFRWQKGVYRSNLYNDWVEDWSKKKHENILQQCRKFINSNNTRTFSRYEKI